ncbi:MAG: hypothetical protein K0U29_05430 [Gammaproteobacteria bacterium]|nr:hypothetical protein [Gammaproteobacteria bacterium]MCH9744359.1 hypothetical protein [Gammaproteobacteria bacterium]
MTLPVKKRVAVVVPQHKADLDPEEALSLSYLRKYLSNYDCYLVHPKGLEFKWDTSGLQLMPLSKRRFQNYHYYNLTCLDTRFYGYFCEYDYILIYQTDACVFKDELQHWCQQGYSFLGGPWAERRFPKLITKSINSLSKSLFSRNIKYSRFLMKKGRYNGNGGFSLRNVDDFIRLLSMPVGEVRLWPLIIKGILPIKLPIYASREFYRSVLYHRIFKPNLQLGRVLRKLLTRQVQQNSRYVVEDVAICSIANIADKNFRIADFLEALRFARDKDCPYWSEIIPFGGHKIFENGKIREEFRERYISEFEA